MCWEKIKAWFHKEKPWTLPHPEEPPNSEATVASVDVSSLLTQFLQSYHVPPEHRSFWQSINIFITTDITSGAETISQIREVKLRPEYANPGTLAHELAHISHFLLSQDEKADFRRAYQEELLVRDSLVQRVYMVKTGSMYNDIEAHAELYRFLGEGTPLNLRPYYPKLF